MLNLYENRKECVPSIALLQNDCAVSGLKFTVLGDYLYFIEGTTIYKVNWTVRNPVQTVFYQSAYPLRHLTSNRDFIAVIEEGSGLMLIEVDSQDVFCFFPEIKEHYSLYDEVIYYNIGLDVYFINMNVNYGTTGHFLTVQQPITQLLCDEEMLVVQLNEPHFHEAQKLLYHLNTDGMELAGHEVKFIASNLSRKIALTDESRAEFYELPAMEFLDYGHLPKKVWRNLSGLDLDNFIPHAYYHEADYNFVCYFKDGSFWVAHLLNPIRDIVKLDTDQVPKWFAVIGPIVVYFDGSIKWVRVR